MPSVETVTVTSVDPENPTEIASEKSRVQIVLKTSGPLYVSGAGLDTVYLQPGQVWLTPAGFAGALSGWTINNGPASVEVKVWERISTTDPAMPLVW